MTVRIIRILEYTYETAEQAEWDMGRWQVQGTYWPKGLGNPTRVVSAVLPPTFLKADEPTKQPTVHGFEQEHSAESPFCGALVLRDVHGDTCGLTREHPIHAKTPIHHTWQGNCCLECEADTTWCDNPPKEPQS